MDLPINRLSIGILLLLMASIDASGDSYGDLCVVVNPLRTPFFGAWLEKNISTRGCAVPGIPGKTPTDEVHFIRVLEAPHDVSVELDDSSETADATRRVVLVLDSDSATRWTVRRSGKKIPEHLTIVVNKDSRVLQNDLRASVMRRQADGRVTLLQYVERRYRNVTSFTEVVAANRLRLRLRQPSGNNKWGTKECDYDTTTASPVVVAWDSKAQNVEGCFHADAVGIYPKDVHIVDLSHDEKDSGTKRKDVLLHLKSSSTDVLEHRSVSLVLKSAVPVRWIVTSDQTLAGTLTVISDHIVHNGGISPMQTLEVRSQSIAENFALLILTVTSELGPPVSYVKPAAGSNRLELLIGKKNPSVKVDLTTSSNGPQYGETGVRSLDRTGSDFSRDVKQRNWLSSGGSSRRSAATALRQALRVQCRGNQMTASLPRFTAQSLGITSMSLSDPSCSAHRNKTHWLVSTPVTSCGSTSSTNGKLTTHSNIVNAQLRTGLVDDEDFEGSGMIGSSSGNVQRVSVPIQCQNEPVFPLGGFDMADDDNVLDPVEPDATQMDLYHMELYRDPAFATPILRDSQKAGSEAEIVFDEFIHVKTWIDGVPFIQIVMEKCWVSNSSDHKHPARLVLIHNTCPAHLSVQLVDPKAENSRGFTFQASRDYAELGSLYVHCRLGLCTNDNSRSQGNLKRCVDPSQYCSGGHVLKPFLENSISSAQQILTKGPLRMVSRVSSVTYGSKREKPSETSNAQNPQVILVGVSTEIAVGIALMSFVIGVGLTAILWWIHLRTDPYRRINKTSGPLNPAA